MEAIYNFGLYLLPAISIFFYALSFLHLSGKIRPGTWVGFSAKGQLMFGLAMTLFSSGIWISQDFRYLSIVLSISYLIVFIIAINVESKAKANLLGEKFL